MAKAKEKRRRRPARKAKQRIKKVAKKAQKPRIRMTEKKLDRTIGEALGIDAFKPLPDVSLFEKQMAGNNEFGFRILSQLPKEGNLFYSPLNIRMALAMTYAGARSRTADEMAEVCAFSRDQKFTHLAMFKLKEELEETGVVQLANNVYVSDDQEVELLFRKVVEEMYRAPFETVNFKKYHEEIRIRINKWVEDKTAQKIRDLLKPGTVTPGNKMVLVSAIYFKDVWVNAFDPKATYNEFFHAPGGDVGASFMHAEDFFAYGEGAGMQIIEMPYRKGLSFVAMLPPMGEKLESLEMSLGSGVLRLPEQLRREKVNVAIPRFKLEYDFSVKQALIALGMPAAFSDDADFTGIAKSQKQRLKIDDVIHKAFCEVNEEGTEAAAATAVTMIRCTNFTPEPQPKVFRADRPFLFAIRENATGNVLFMGRVERP